MGRIFILAVVCHLLLISEASLSIPEDVKDSNEESPVPSTTLEEPVMDYLWVNPYFRYIGKRSNTRDNKYSLKEDDYR